MEKRGLDCGLGRILRARGPAGRVSRRRRSALCTADLVADYFWWSHTNFDALSSQCAALYAEKACCFTRGRCHDPDGTRFGATAVWTALTS